MASVGFQQLRRDQANQPKPDHDNGLPQCRVDQPDALQPNGADHGECRLFITHPFWNLGDKVLGNAHILGVWAVGCHAVANFKLCHVPTHLDNLTHIAVSERNGLFQLVFDCGNGWSKSVCLHLRNDLLDFVGLLSGFLNERPFSKIDKHLLSAQ